MFKYKLRFFKSSLFAEKIKMSFQFIIRSLKLFIVMISAPLWSQEEERKTYTVTLAPLALADVYDGASFRPGFEMQVSKSVSLALETGLYLPYLPATKIRPHGYLVKPMVRYWLSKKGKTQNYIAGEYFFKDQDYNFKDTLETGTIRYVKRYAMKRAVHGLSMRYGRVKQIGKKFMLDFYGGVGARHIRSTSDLTEAESDAILTGIDGDCPLQQDILRITGNRWYPNFLLGIRIGYQL